MRKKMSLDKFGTFHIFAFLNNCLQIFAPPDPSAIHTHSISLTLVSSPRQHSLHEAYAGARQHGPQSQLHHLLAVGLLQVI
jgi:hypothetical protein